MIIWQTYRSHSQAARPVILYLIINEIFHLMWSWHQLQLSVIICVHLGIFRAGHGWAMCWPWVGHGRWVGDGWAMGGPCVGHVWAMCVLTHKAIEVIISVMWSCQWWRIHICHHTNNMIILSHIFVNLVSGRVWYDWHGWAIDHGWSQWYIMSLMWSYQWCDHVIGGDGWAMGGPCVCWHKVIEVL